MAQPGLIEDYLRHLAERLPAPVVAELADGLQETYLSNRSAGHAPDDAARRAVTEFGDPSTVIAAFAAASPARRAARAVLMTGPFLAAAWATALIALRCWDWPVSDWARAGSATALITAIGLLTVAAISPRYWPAARSATAACLAVLAIDASLISYVTAAGLLRTWPDLLAVPLSSARGAFTLSRLPRVLHAYR